MRHENKFIYTKKRLIKEISLVERRESSEELAISNYYQYKEKIYKS